MADLIYPLLIILLGWVLILLEIGVVPGFGLVGISGFICLIVGIAWAWSSFGVVWGVGLLLLSVILLPLVIYLFLKSKASRRLIREEKIEGVSTDRESLEALVGKSGVAVSDLRPSGVVEIDSLRYDATTNGEYIEKGSKIVVESVGTNCIIVTKSVADNSE